MNQLLGRDSSEGTASSTSDTQACTPVTRPQPALRPLLSRWLARTPSENAINGSVADRMSALKSSDSLTPGIVVKAAAGGHGRRARGLVAPEEITASSSSSTARVAASTPVPVITGVLSMTASNRHDGETSHRTPCDARLHHRQSEAVADTDGDAPIPNRHAVESSVHVPEPPTQAAGGRQCLRDVAEGLGSTVTSWQLPPEDVPSSSRVPPIRRGVPSAMPADSLSKLGSPRSSNSDVFTPRRAPSAASRIGRTEYETRGECANSACREDAGGWDSDCCGKESEEGFDTPASSSGGGDACAICLSPMVLKSGARSLYTINKCQVCLSGADGWYAGGERLNFVSFCPRRIRFYCVCNCRVYSPNIRFCLRVLFDKQGPTVMMRRISGPECERSRRFPADHLHEAACVENPYRVFASLPCFVALTAGHGRPARQASVCLCLKVGGNVYSDDDKTHLPPCFPKTAARLSLWCELVHAL